MRHTRFVDLMSRLNNCESPLPNDIILCNGYATKTDRNSINLDNYPGTPLRKPVIGVSLINEIIYKFIVDNSIPMSIMIEDDIDLHCSDTSWINTLINEFSNVNYHIAYFGSREIPIKGYQVTPNLYEVDFSNILHPNVPHSWCSAFGYFLKLEGAKRLLNNFYPLQLPIDLYLSNRIFYNHLNGLIVDIDLLIKEVDNIHDTEIP
jgi:hypothetical protein